MNRLGEKSLHTLEYHTVLARLASHCISEEGKAQALALRPLTDFDEAVQALQQTTDAKDQMRLHSVPAFAKLGHVLEATRRAEQGGTLSFQELLSVCKLLTTARRVQGYGVQIEDLGSLAPYFSMLCGNRALEEEIAKCIVSEEEMADHASHELLHIRREMRRIAGKVRETLSRLIAGERAKYLQEAIVTQRAGRYVVPVKAEHRGAIVGLIHDTSSTGATLFVEPEQVVEINNQIKVLEGKEEAEIERILRQLSGEVAKIGASIRQDFAMLGTLDFIFAKAKLSYQQEGNAPHLVENGGVRLQKARHPLLDPKKAVPIDIALGETYDTLIITGPNTGGKTVSLKTLGLLSLMTASGLHIPASETSQMTLFANVYADIGDEQSIEQSLSTFSAHMKNIVAITSCVGTHDLVLFDELGAGTDPVEGAALAVAVIQFARTQGACVAATTHYAELKTFALTTQGIENASCEFDVQSLRPTYHLLTGVPGRSNAFAIAARLGLQTQIIEQAKEELSGESARFEEVLRELEKERKRLAQTKAEIDAFRRTAQSEKDKAMTLKGQSEDKADAIVQRAKEQAERILQEARLASDTVFAELKALQKRQEQSASEENLANAKAVLQGYIKEAEKNSKPTAIKRTINPEEQGTLQAGDEVRLLNLSGMVATVLAPPDANGQVQVQAGVMKMKLPQNEMQKVEQAKKPKKPPVARTHGAKELNLQTTPQEIDVRGMCADEAIAEVERFLSSAILAKHGQLTIIHGKGTGVLRTAIQQHLKRMKQVKQVRSGTYGEGENGVTIVTLR